jgi:signal peptidase II
MDILPPAAQPGQAAEKSFLGFIKNYWLDYGVLFLIAGLILALDQWTKVWVRTHVPLGGDWLPDGLAWLMPYARVRYWYNSGAAFGIFQNGNTIFMVLAVIVAAAILYYLPRTARKDWWLRLALGMQFAGALGNLVDRFQFGHVTDFISVGNFAIFNVADSSISVGVAILILGVWLTETAEKKRLAAQRAAAAGEGETPGAKDAAPGPKDEAKRAYQNPAPGGVPAAGDVGESSFVKGSKSE